MTKLELLEQMALATTAKIKRYPFDLSVYVSEEDDVEPEVHTNDHDVWEWFELEFEGKVDGFQALSLTVDAYGLVSLEAQGWDDSQHLVVRNLDGDYSALPDLYAATDISAGYVWDIKRREIISRSLVSEEDIRHVGPYIAKLVSGNLNASVPAGEVYTPPETDARLQPYSRPQPYTSMAYEYMCDINNKDKRHEVAEWLATATVPESRQGKATFFDAFRVMNRMATPDSSSLSSIADMMTTEGKFKWAENTGILVTPETYIPEARVIDPFTPSCTFLIHNPELWGGYQSINRMLELVCRRATYYNTNFQYRLQGAQHLELTVNVTTHPESIDFRVWINGDPMIFTTFSSVRSEFAWAVHHVDDSQGALQGLFNGVLLTVMPVLTLLKLGKVDVRQHTRAESLGFADLLLPERFSFTDMVMTDRLHVAETADKEMNLYPEMQNRIENPAINLL